MCVCIGFSGGGLFGYSRQNSQPEVLVAWSMGQGAGGLGQHVPPVCGLIGALEGLRVPPAGSPNFLLVWISN